MKRSSVISDQIKRPAQTTCSTMQGCWKITTRKCQQCGWKADFAVCWKWTLIFYAYVSVRRWSILIIVQRGATQSSVFIFLQVHSTCFGCQPHPSSGVHETVTTASGIGHIFCAATSLQRGQASLLGCFVLHLFEQLLILIFKFNLLKQRKRKFGCSSNDVM